MKKEMKKIYHTCEEKSEVLIKSTNKSQEKLDKAKSMINRLSKNKYIFPIINDTIMVVSLLSDFVKKKYSIKKSVAIGLLAGVIYLVMPFDAIPDFTPIVGYLDDALILVGAFSKFRLVIDDYRNYLNIQRNITDSNNFSQLNSSS